MGRAAYHSHVLLRGFHQRVLLAPRLSDDLDVGRGEREAGGTVVERIGIELRLSVGVSGPSFMARRNVGVRERFLERALSHCLMYVVFTSDCASRPLPFRSPLRVDAQAGDGTVEMGTWWPYHDEGRAAADRSIAMAGGPIDTRRLSMGVQNRYGRIASCPPPGSRLMQS